MSGWVGGLAEWDEADTTYLSVAFTWLLDKAANRAMIARALGKRVVAGGPALFLKSMRHEIEDFAEIGATYPDAIARHNPLATIASRGCPVGCGFCIVPAMEGREFTLLPDFPVRPVLCDNNLSALPADYQDYIIGRFVETRTPLLDANSGFEPMTFTPNVYARWKPLLNAGGGPWRFAFDEWAEAGDVLRVLEMLKGEPAKRKQVYVLIGNEPFAECMARIMFVLKNGAEVHVQPYMKLNALEKRPHVRFDWTEQALRNVTRWSNRRIWRKTLFADYDRHEKRTRRSESAMTPNRAFSYERDEVHAALRLERALRAFLHDGHAVVSGVSTQHLISHFERREAFDDRSSDGVFRIRHSTAATRYPRSRERDGHFELLIPVHEPSCVRAPILDQA